MLGFKLTTSPFSITNLPGLRPNLSKCWMILSTKLCYLKTISFAIARGKSGWLSLSHFFCKKNWRWQLEYESPPLNLAQNWIRKSTSINFWRELYLLKKPVLFYIRDIFRTTELLTIKRWRTVRPCQNKFQHCINTILRNISLKSINLSL